jgi:hypothetical protein
MKWVEPVRWLARLLGAVPVVIGWFFMIAEAVAGPSGDGEGVAVAVMLVVLTASTVAAWRWERSGAAAEVIAALAFGVLVYVTAGHNRILAALLLPLPWFLSGLLLFAINSLRQDTSRPLRRHM